MPDETGLTPDLQAFAARLASLSPRAASIDRDRLMYEAGRSAGGRRSHATGYAATFVVAAAALLLGRWSVESRPSVTPDSSITLQTSTADVVVEQPMETPPDPTVPFGYLQLRSRLTADAWTEPATVASTTSRDTPQSIGAARRAWLESLN